MMDRDSITRAGARAPGAWRYSSKWLAPTQCGEKRHTQASAKRGSQLHRLLRPAGRLHVKGQPWSRTAENPPYGILGGTMETSASFEVRSSPSSYPTSRVTPLHLAGTYFSLHDHSRFIRESTRPGQVV